MRIVHCEKCAGQVPLRDDRPPPWCPHCGANFKAAAALPAAAALLAAAGGFGARTRGVRADGIAAAVRTFDRVDHADAPDAAGPPAAPGKTAVSCCRRYHCLPCGCVYQVRVADLDEGGLTALALGTATGQATNPRLAAADHPCPTCGLVRPEYAIRWQFGGHATVLCLALVVACVVGALVVSHSPWVKPTALMASAAAGVAALLHLWIALTNPNRGRGARLKRAQAAVAAGEMEVLRPGSLQGFRDPAQPAAGHWLAFLALVLAPLPFLAPVLVRSTLHLPANPGLAPDVIGPGDVVRVPVPASRLRGLRGYWRASATAQLLNAEEVGGPGAFTASSRSESWGNSISIRKAPGVSRGNADYNVPINDLYADVHVPNWPALGGKTLRVKVTLNVTHPVGRGQQQLFLSRGEAFQDQTSTVSTDVVFHLAAGGDDRAYRAAWEYGAALGGLFYFAGGVGLFLLTRGRRPGGCPPELVPGHEPLLA